MKRFALILTAVTALAVFVTPSANAADNSSWYGPHHGYVGHSYVSHAYVTLVYGYGIVQHGYAATAYVGHGYYRSYGHGGGVRISTPHFGLRIGH